MADPVRNATAAPRSDDSRQRAERLRARNLRTALVFATIAATFFVGVIASRFLGVGDTGMTVVGFAVFVFLAFAIGRNLRKGR